MIQYQVNYTFDDSLNACQIYLQVNHNVPSWVQYTRTVCVSLSLSLLFDSPFLSRFDFVLFFPSSLEWRTRRVDNVFTFWFSADFTEMPMHTIETSHFAAKKKEKKTIIKRRQTQHCHAHGRLWRQREMECATCWLMINSINWLWVWCPLSTMSGLHTNMSYIVYHFHFILSHSLLLLLWSLLMPQESAILSNRWVVWLSYCPIKNHRYFMYINPFRPIIFKPISIGRLNKKWN